jgi:hypothetical protein
MDHERTEYDGANVTELDQDQVQRSDFVNTVMKLSGYLKGTEVLDRLSD